MALLIMIISAIYYFLPAYFANMAPVVFKKINPLNQPVDFNKRLYKQPIFGANKTWGGIILATLIGILTFYLQTIFYQFPFFQKYSLINYTEYSLMLGFLLGFGAIFGDLIKSFFKRRYQIKPGQSWIPFDQLDFVLGAFLFSFIFYIPPVSAILIVIILTPFLHILANQLGYYLKIKKSKW